MATYLAFLGCIRSSKCSFYIYKVIQVVFNFCIMLIILVLSAMYCITQNVCQILAKTIIFTFIPWILHYFFLLITIGVYYKQHHSFPATVQLPHSGFKKKKSALSRFPAECLLTVVH